MRPFEQSCEVWSQHQGQWTYVETIPCGLFPSGDSGPMWFSALRPGPGPGNRLKEPGKGGRPATWWEITKIEAVSGDTPHTFQVTVHRCDPPPGHPTS